MDAHPQPWVHVPSRRLSGWTHASGLLPSQHWLKQQHPGPPLNQMQRINYENLSQAPSALKWSGLPPTPCRESLQPPGGWGVSWDTAKLAGDARAGPKSKSAQDQATQERLRMSHTVDTETEPQVGPPLGPRVPALMSAAGAPCPVFILSTVAKAIYLFHVERKPRWVASLHVLCRFPTPPRNVCATPVLPTGPGP